MGKIDLGAADLAEQAKAKACCADLYQSELARMILGDTMHPGGLALTNRLGKLIDIKPGEWVVDLASSRGASAMAVSRVFKCNVVGVEFGREAVTEAHQASQSASQGKTPGKSRSPRSHHLQGDAESPPLRPGIFDAVFCECAMSLFPDKAGAVAETVSLLRPGGRFGLSDVTVEPGSLPPELDSTLGQLLCLTDALTVDGYVRLLEEGGLQLVHRIDASIEAVKILDALESKLGAFLAWQKLTGEAGPDPELLSRGPQVLTELRELIKQGRLGYWIFVAEKPKD